VEFGALNAVGIWFYAKSTDRCLYLLRNDNRHPDTWGLPGGKCSAGETLVESIERECHEELGCFPESAKLIPIEKFTSPDGKFFYHTFFCPIADEFVPHLNHEHLGWAWVDSNTWPKPLHPGLWSTVKFEEIQEKIKVIKSRL
jgi:8-oxo-dGTP pyrophosphatase MutT (NUDIX family)